MPGSNKKKRVYQDWRGNYTFALWQQRHNKPDSQGWVGYNCQVYSDGSVGPGPESIAFNLDNRSGTYSFPSFDYTTDKFLGMCVYENPGGTTGDFTLAMFTAGWQRGRNWYYDWTVPSSVTKFDTTVTLSYPNPGEQPRGWKHPQVVFPHGKYATTVTLDGKDIFVGGQDKFDGTGNTAITVTPATASAYSCVHKDRLYTTPGVEGSNPMRVAYSDPADYTTFTSASQFFDLADSTSGDAIGGMYSLGNQLLIYSLMGNWYVLSGDAATGSVKKLGNGPIPAVHNAAVVFKNQVMFLGGPHLGVVIVDASGIDTQSLLEINPFRGLSDGPLYGGSLESGYEGSKTYGYEIGPAVVDEQYGYMGFLVECPTPRTPWSGNPVMLEYVNGMWSMYQYDPGTPGNLSSIDLTRVLGACAGLGRVFIAVPCVLSNGTTDAIAIVDRVIAADSPLNHHLVSSANASDDDFGLRGASAGNMRIFLNPITSPDDKEVRPIAVTVHGKYWTSSSADSTFNTSAGITVSAYEDEDTLIGLGASLDGNGTIASSGNNTREPFTKTFTFAEYDFYDRFELHFNTTSVSIDKIVVEYEERETPRY